MPDREELGLRFKKDPDRDELLWLIARHLHDRFDTGLRRTRWEDMSESLREIWWGEADRLYDAVYAAGYGIIGPGEGETVEAFSVTIDQTGKQAWMVGFVEGPGTYLLIPIDEEEG